MWFTSSVVDCDEEDDDDDDDDDDDEDQCWNKQNKITMLMIDWDASIWRLCKVFVSDQCLQPFFQALLVWD